MENNTKSIKLEKFFYNVDYLNKAIELSGTGVEDTILNDSIMIRFSLVYESACKVLKDYLNQKGIVTNTLPDEIFNSAIFYEVISNEDIWMNMIKDRTLTEDDYDNLDNFYKHYADVSNRIKNEYAPEINKLVEKLKA